MKPFVWRGVTGRWYVESESSVMGGRRMPEGDSIGSEDGYPSWREAYDVALAHVLWEPA